MSKNLVIVESPTKERTISRFLDKNFLVRSSYGHIRDLPAHKLGVDVKNDFNPSYQLIPNARKIVKNLEPLVNKSKAVYLATDFDREGEAIAWHLKESLKIPAEKLQRITFHEITLEAIREALAHPRQIDQHLVDAQQARRVLDRLVGYKLSPLLWRKVKRGLSAGRVQSVALRLICDREEEIKKFVQQEYWQLWVELARNEHILKALLIRYQDKKLEREDIPNQPGVQKITDEIGSSPKFRVTQIERKERKRKALPPFATASLQQEAARKLGFTAQKTMFIAQQLYEGIELGSEGSIGLITYMRTDSYQVARSAQEEARDFILQHWGKEFLPDRPPQYRTKIKTAQEAHEAIRPTAISRTPELVSAYLTADQRKLYELIWRRFLASQMREACYETVQLDIKAGDYTFRANGRRLIFSGFLAIYDLLEEEEPITANLVDLDLKEGEELTFKQFLPEQHFTEPPPRYNEASLIKTLEENGIGRPSTYAPIMQTLKSRSYVRFENRNFLPTTLGETVNGLLRDFFPKIVDVGFTAQLEENLDHIARGEKIWNVVVKDFYLPLEKLLAEAEQKIQRIKFTPKPSTEKCPLCGAILLFREGRYGQFLACSNFPQCRYRASLDRQGNRKQSQPIGEKCPRCGKPLVRRDGRRGTFIACSGYPRCRYTRKSEAAQTEKENPPAIDNNSPGTKEVNSEGPSAE